MTLSPKFAAPQHGPRPLPLFLQMVQERTQGDPVRLARVLEGLRLYQEAKRPKRVRRAPIIARIGSAVLRDYGGSGPDILFVPSLINPPFVLDMGRRSLLKWMARQGRRVLLLDWGPLGVMRRRLSVAQHVEQILLPMMARLPSPPDLVGYCLGGTMAAAAAGPGKAHSLALIAAPWHFSGFGESGRAQLADLWAQSRQVGEALDLVPMEVLQQGFWSLDPERTVSKFEAFAEMDGVEAKAFVQLEDWANEGAPLSMPAAREVFEDFVDADTPGQGRWSVGNMVAAPERLPCPVLNIVSTTDRIVPAASAAQAGERIDLARGHVGMIVGSKARQEVWAPLRNWLG